MNSFYKLNLLLV